MIHLIYFIKQTALENEFLVPSTQDSIQFYTVNSSIGTCSYSVGMTGAPCKNQGAVSVKFHIANFNFLPSLTPNDCMVYSYIAIGKYVSFLYWLYEY